VQTLWKDLETPEFKTENFQAGKSQKKALVLENPGKCLENGMK